MSDAQKDLDAGIVSTEADADRVGEVLHLWPQVLMQDPRVAAAYDVWRERHASDLPEAIRAMHVLTEEWPPHPALLVQPGVDLLMADMQLLNGLVKDLGPHTQFSWLASMLWFTFAQATHAPELPLKVTLSDEAVFVGKGTAPKQGEVHHEDLRRNLTWFYSATIHVCFRPRGPHRTKATASPRCTTPWQP